MKKEMITTKMVEAVENALLKDKHVINKIRAIMLEPDYKLTTIVYEIGDGGTILIHVNNKPEICISIVDKYGAITKLNSFDAHFGYFNGFSPSGVCKYMDKLDKHLFDLLWPQDAQDIIDNIKEGYNIKKEQPINLNRVPTITSGDSSIFNFLNY